MNNYQVFDYDNKDTWPIKSKLLLLWIESYNYPIVCIFNNIDFIDMNGDYYHSWLLSKSIYYYISKKPKIIAEYAATKCGNGEKAYKCPYFDDGYCLKDKCKDQIINKEYSIE